MGKALVDLHLAGSFLTDDRAARLAAANANAIKALSRAPNRALAHFALGTICALTNRNAKQWPNASMRWRSTATSLTPMRMIGTAKTALGRADEAEGDIRQALRTKSAAERHGASSAEQRRHGEAASRRG